MVSQKDRIIVTGITTHMESIVIIKHLEHMTNAMSDREVTRGQHNRIYSQPISLCECTNDLILHRQISI